MVQQGYSSDSGLHGLITDKIIYKDIMIRTGKTYATNSSIILPAIPVAL